MNTEGWNKEIRRDNEGQIEQEIGGRGGGFHIKMLLNVPHHLHPFLTGFSTNKIAALTALKGEKRDKKKSQKSPTLKENHTKVCVRACECVRVHSCVTVWLCVAYNNEDLKVKSDTCLTRRTRVCILSPDGRVRGEGDKEKEWETEWSDRQRGEARRLAESF